mmetsp:Transcript_15873/g.55261  ORF Transcript_15873/g.55261 Transcript_15873/m.55261 type:complete len:418 (+) Transcript_15873:878-2131(+)
MEPASRSLLHGGSARHRVVPHLRHRGPARAAAPPRPHHHLPHLCVQAAPAAAGLLLAGGGGARDGLPHDSVSHHHDPVGRDGGRHAHRRRAHRRAPLRPLGAVVQHLRGHVRDRAGGAHALAALRAPHHGGLAPSCLPDGPRRGGRRLAAADAHRRRQPEDRRALAPVARAQPRQRRRRRGRRPCVRRRQRRRPRPVVAAAAVARVGGVAARASWDVDVHDAVAREDEHHGLGGDGQRARRRPLRQRARRPAARGHHLGRRRRAALRVEPRRALARPPRGRRGARRGRGGPAAHPQAGADRADAARLFRGAPGARVRRRKPAVLDAERRGAGGVRRAAAGADGERAAAVAARDLRAGGRADAGKREQPGARGVRGGDGVGRRQQRRRGRRRRRRRRRQRARRRLGVGDVGGARRRRA